ncbi:CLUMA_CG007526, isoform A [Clunio marinus]|uniref:CLUMA_CG007526, isoform A n=1 Tax=Clunio marinus TaxID=568069 RepID=A0A1J1I6G6_9DIPT|nr:CLUMA_CG007526, isoform A [Clunio marinus]
MAPFKLFRMNQGSTSRSTSQETEPDQPVNLVITTPSLNKLTTVMTPSSAHYLNVDESDQNSENSSLMSLNNDQRALLSSGSTVDQIGYSSPQLSDIPISPPPSYEAVMKENHLLALDKENNSIQTTIHTNLLVESFYNTSHASNNNLLNEMNEFKTNSAQSIVSPARENLLIDGSECTDQCNHGSCNCINNEVGGNNNENYGEYDERCLENDLAERCSLENNENCSENYNNCSEDYTTECQNQYQDSDYSNQYCNEDDGGGQQQMNYTEVKGPEILYKSSKELYKAVAKQCGIQCKMTDTCRCVDCQSRYFDCEFDQNENEKTDGGLGAGNGAINYGTPMFVNEVLHGTACVIL